MRTSTPITGRRQLRHGAMFAIAALLTLTMLSPQTARAAEPTTTGWRDDFTGSSLSADWNITNEDTDAYSVADGKLAVSGQAGDTYQGTNTAKNIFMVDVPAGDFTAVTKLSAPVGKVYQGAGLIAWKDIDNYVRSGLTFVGNLSPSGIAVENDVETGASFRAASFADLPGASSVTLRLQRVGATITTSYWNDETDAWIPAGSVDVAFETTQVGLYALGAQDGTALPTTFDYFSVDAAQGDDIVPSTTFALRSVGDKPYLVSDGTDLRLTTAPPTASLRLTAEAAGDGAVNLRTKDDGKPVAVDDGRLTLGTDPTALRLTDAGGGKLFIRSADGDSYATEGDNGAIVMGDRQDAARFTLTEVDDDTASLHVDGAGKGASISDTMFGIFFEDINYAADGGLYAELVRNRSFEFNSSDNGSFTGLTGWQTLDRSGNGTTASVVNDGERLNAMNRNYLKLDAAAAGDGVRNTSFNNGVAVKAGATYTASIWARSTTAQDLTLRVENNANTVVAATAKVAVDGSDTWKKYDVEVTATDTTDSGRYAVLAGAASTIRIDMVSFMPEDRWVGPVNGKSVLRKDLAEKVADMKPSFVRFPGGCVTNVGTFNSYEESNYTDRKRTYQWKETIGPVEQRPTNWNFWGYNQSYGIGYLEYFELAEDLGAQPLPVLSVGANGCGGAGLAEMHDPAQIARWVDDTVDLIEFANGGTDTEWGAKRAALGHPKPFGLKMIGLGNEENTTTFEANFPKFRDAIKAKYPDIKIISNAGPDSSGARFDTLWNFNRAQKVDLVDEHYYRDPSWFLANNHRYDTYDRSGPKVFLGEYASRGNTFGNALSEASYMTALQRNADVVRLASYAPLLANESNVQWTPDAIWFDNDESWSSPNWEVQKMFGNNVGDEVVPSTFDGAVNQPEDISGGVFLSTWSTAAAYDNLTVKSNDTGDTLFSDQFDDASKWSPQSGTWAATGGKYVQSSTSVNDARSIVTGAYAKDWSNYTLELDATKQSGAEGFLVGFGAKDTNDFYWWNIGGWNNTRSVLQKASGGAASEVKALENTSLVTGQTYHIKVVVEGHTIKLYLDGELQMSYDEAASTEKLFQVVTRDKKSGDLVAKVVNTATKPVRTAVDVSDVGIKGTGKVTQLTASSLADTNSKASKTKVVPFTSSVDGLSDSFSYEFPASSVTFLRMETVDAEAPVVSSLDLEGASSRGTYADPVTVKVEATDDRKVDHLEVSVDGGAFTAKDGANASFEVAGNGAHTVAVRAVDSSGNVGETRPVSFTIDATPPVSKAVVDAEARTVTLTAADSGAGLDRIEFRVGAGDWATYAQPVTVGDEETTVEFRAIDKLGNVEATNASVVPAKGQQLTATVTALTLSSSAIRVGDKTTATVRVKATAGTPTGEVSIRSGATLIASGVLTNGQVVLSLKASSLGVGTRTLVARYAGSAAHAASEDSAGITVSKASSRTRATVSPTTVKRSQRAKVSVTVTTSPSTARGGTATVKVYRDGKLVTERTGQVSSTGRVTITLPRLSKRDTYSLRVRYSGTATVTGSSAASIHLRVK
ncbi:alpha-L-arabinofuranosidase C-terminal domain-containing protein [Aeromicrobium sp. Root236]|uniref:alpha-L-arabinofuranosidase C-terminal domain-containing protein n=1 Tax=Aeromicrobium sp. Root236 TaxID=1736498 RepID=UPI000A9EB4C1|nr:alpha-L-arabinofuranosidase C-terminal domain-containing protein [Aeromicrobium sp. Root236]